MRRKTRTLLTYIVGVGLLVLLITQLVRYRHDKVAARRKHRDKALHQEEKKLFPKPNKGREQDGDLDRIDWHDHVRIKRDQERAGPGEQGKPVELNAEERGPHAYEECGFNIKASNKISLDRAIPDIRHPNCATKKHVRHLPDVSVVIPFHNEGWTTLLRTVHSVLNRSPEPLVHEIVLVDDFSDRAHLGQHLEDYVAKLSPKVRVIRTKQREGLIRTRLLGAQVAQGDVLIFLDSHCEANVNWLPPLLEPIALNRKTIVCPNIDVIDKDDFHYETQAGDSMRGAFDWEMYYKRIPIPEEIRNPDPSDVFESPVMAGGLFAVDREYFEELGGYDPGLDIWGGEQYELSFKFTHGPRTEPWGTPADGDFHSGAAPWMTTRWRLLER